MNKEKNYAFIDSQNLNMGIKESGWSLDYRKFFVYLTEKYFVIKVYLFIGYLPENQNMYSKLQEIGYILVFKPVLLDKNGKAKGNVDADLVLNAVLKINEYEKAVVVSSDGDFYSLIDCLYAKRKLKCVLSPNKKKCSVLLRKSAKEKIIFMDNLKSKLAYKKKNTA